MPNVPRITRKLAEQAETLALASPSEEVCGIFWWPDPNPWGNDPHFLQLPNNHMEPERAFMTDHNDIEFAFLDRFGDRLHVNGEVALFHSHPFTVGQRSREDELAIETFAKEMDGHPMLRPTFRHLIFSLWDHSWWWFDLETFGRVGWEWPA